MLKFSFDTEPYALKYMNRNKRSIFAQLRMGILPLRVETGRFQNLDLVDRKCVYCISGQIEDENHFIFNCSHYNHLRTPFLNKCKDVDENFENFDEIEKFRFVLNNEAMQIHTANFAQEAFFHRKNT